MGEIEYVMGEIESITLYDAASGMSRCRLRRINKKRPGWLAGLDFLRLIGYTGYDFFCSLMQGSLPV